MYCDPPAGRMIEESGLKGARVGGAEVSRVHANFVVNRGSATSGDVLEPLRRVGRASSWAGGRAGARGASLRKGMERHPMNTPVVAVFARRDFRRARSLKRLGRRLRQCVTCSALAADLRSELDGLREVRTESLAAEHYAAVRGRVLAELARAPRRRVVWPWAWAAALVGAAAAVLMVVMMKPAAVPAPDLPRVVAVAPMVEQHVPREPGSNRRLKSV